MERRDLGYPLTAGVAALLIVGALVTDLAFSAVTFRPVVGGAVAAVAGVTAAAFVALGLADEGALGRRRGAFTVGIFGLVFLLVVFVEGIVLSTRLSVTLPVAILVGTGFGLYAFVRATGAG